MGEHKTPLSLQANAWQSSKFGLSIKRNNQLDCHGVGTPRNDKEEINKNKEKSKRKSGLCGHKVFFYET